MEDGEMGCRETAPKAPFLSTPESVIFNIINALKGIRKKRR
jgi:hypothetical protein